MSDTKIDLKDYRQPMVTSLGVILGFLVGFLGQWVTEDNFKLKNINDGIFFVGCFAGALLLFIALFRMLSPKAPSDAALVFSYYYRTLIVYMAGVVIAFCSILISAFI
jgi:hypothetical protein